MIRKLFLQFYLVALVAACGGEGPAASVGLPPEGAVDSTPPPEPPPPDSTPVEPPPPQDSVGTPPDSLPPYTPVHVGIPFGPTQQEAKDFSPEYSGTLVPGNDSTMLLTLEAARRANLRLFIHFTGSEMNYRDQNGFNFAMWKARVDRFRDMDLSSYIADGTIIGHRILDEPSDRNNWNGHVVSLEDIEAMAKYSKEIWPTMPAVIRAWPEYLKGYPFKHLDAAWAQYTVRFGSVEEFIASNIRDAKEAGLGLIAGLNLLDGGSGESGIKGRQGARRQLWGMSAGEIRKWGNVIMAQPDICAFLMFEYNASYLAHQDIRQALAELAQKAKTHPGGECRRR
jgi:hypothetical protein